MSLYFVRWYDPSRPHPLKRDFHTRKDAMAFRARLGLLSEPPKRYSDSEPHRDHLRQ